MFNLNRKSILSPVIKSSVILLLVVLGVFAVSIVHAATTSYDNTATGTITDNACGVTPLVLTFNVLSSMSITDVDLGLNITHGSRGHLQVNLTSPQLTSVQVIAINAIDGTSHYDLLLDDASSNIINDGSNDTIAPPIYDGERIAKPSNPLSAFNGQNAQGTWTLTICDGIVGGTGTYNSSQLRISSSSAVGGTAEYIAVDTAKGMTGWLLVGASSLALVMGMVGGLWAWRQR